MDFKDIWTSQQLYYDYELLFFLQHSRDLVNRSTVSKTDAATDEHVDADRWGDFWLFLQFTILMPVGS